MNKALSYLVAGAVLLLVAGFANAYTVNVAVATGYPVSYSHYCAYSEYYNYYACQPYVSGYYCDPFDPFYYQYCYSPYVYNYAPYSTYYPTYVANPGTIVYTSSGTPAAQPQGPPCSDGTQSGMCSSDFPKYCFNGQLIEKATLCGCPAGQTQDENNRNRCVAQLCSDGTALNSCSSSKPQFCTSNANLVDRPTQCGCPTGSKLEGSVCAPLNSICFVSSVSPSTVRAGQSAVVSVSYSDVQNAHGYVNCGNGQVASLACNGGVSGSCLASCSYSSQATPTVQAYVNGNLCSSSANVNVVPALPTTGTALIRVTDCATGRGIPGASISAGGASVVTNANGEATATSLALGSGSVIVNANGYSTGFSSLVSQSGSTSIVPVCLSSVPACDVGIALAGTVTTNNVQNGVQLIVTNNLPESNNVAISYSSPVTVNGPQSVSLAPLESKIITIYPQVSQSTSVSGTASVTARGKQACSSTANVLLNLNGGLSLRALTTSQVAHGGSEVCYDLVLQNRAGQDATVTLSGSAPGVTVNFYNSRFVLANGETRNARMCASIPEGATGSRTITINANSALNPVSTSVELIVNPFMSSNVLGCFSVNTSTTQFVEVQLTNTGPGESFVARLTPTLSFTPRLTQENLFNFVNRSTRSLFIQLDPSSMNELEGRATLTVSAKESSAKVFEQELCFRKAGTFDSNVLVTPVRVSVQQGKIGRSFVHVKNTGNTVDNYAIEIAAPFSAISVNSAMFSVQPGQDKAIEIVLSPSTSVPAATYLVPIDVYSLHDPALRTKVSTVNLVVDVTNAPTTALRLVLANPPVISFNQSASLIYIKVPVVNYEDDSRTITPSIAGLPAGWTYTVNPSQVTLPKLGMTDFNFVVKTQGIEAKDYNATLMFTDESGRQVTQGIVLPAKSSNWMTGLFTLGSSGQLFTALIVILVLAGLYLLYRAWQLRQTINQQEALVERR
ncbi:MAG: hypothetical protein V1722_01380 [Candidatus Micrarchaeota archaeon]